MRPRLVSRAIGNESGSELCVVMSLNGLRSSKLFCQVLNPDGRPEPSAVPANMEAYTCSDPNRGFPLCWHALPTNKDNLEDL